MQYFKNCKKKVTQQDHLIGKKAKDNNDQLQYSLAYTFIEIISPWMHCVSATYF